MPVAKEKKKNLFISYLENSYQELRKVAWPTRNQAVRLTFLVLGFVVAVAALVGVLDYVFGIGHRTLLNLAPQRALPVVEEALTPEEPLSGGIEVGGITAVDTDGEVVVNEGLLPDEGTTSAPSAEAESTPTE